MNTSFSDIDQLLRHPLFLVLATGLISSYLIPRLTRRWQDHQKAIETRTRFASEITESVVKFILAVQIAERKTIEQDVAKRKIEQDDYNKAYQEWEVKRATLGSQIRGYFQDPQLALDWASLSEAVTEIYALSGTWDEPYRSEVLGRIKAAILDEEIDWESLSDYELKQKSNDDFQRYFKAWWAVREALLLRTGDFVKRILEARTTSFR